MDKETKELLETLCKGLPGIKIRASSFKKDVIFTVTGISSVNEDSNLFAVHCKDGDCEYVLPSNLCEVVSDEIIFPELVESEDERIRKSIIAILNNYVDNSNTFKPKMLAWLEKQGQVKESSIPQHENKTCEENSNSLTSEDERIRKSLITFFQRFPYDSIEKAGTSAKDAIAWLEKQCKPIDEEKVLIGARKGVALSIINYLDNNSVGMCLSSIECEDIEDACVNSKWIKLYNYMKKKLEKQGSPVLSNSSNVVKDVECSADRIVPKFKVGDWIVQKNIGVFKIIEICESWYEVNDTEGFHYSISFVREYMCHLWSITDAKDGDVLACESGWTCIFKTLVSDETFSSYCFMDKTKWFCETESECHTLNKEFTKAYSGEIKPATKEQRDLLFSKMKEAGYVWDSDHKKLKKIEMTDLAEDYIKQKPTWSEEDEERIKNIFSVLDAQVCWDGAIGEKKNPYQKEIEWLKSLKQRLGGGKSL